MINRFKTVEEDDDIKMVTDPFNIYNVAVANQVFASLLIHALKYCDAKESISKQNSDEYRVLKLIDNVMAAASSYEFIKEVERQFARIFHCERVNFLLVHRFKKFIYRIVIDEKTGSEEMQKFDFDSGLAGFVTVAGHCVFSEHTRNDARFMREIDDPQGIGNKTTRQVVSCPIFTKTDVIATSGKGLANYPRAVI